MNDTIKRAARALLDDPSDAHARSLLASLLTRGGGVDTLTRVEAVLERLEHRAGLAPGRYVQVSSVGADGVWHAGPLWPQAAADVGELLGALRDRFPARQWVISEVRIDEPAWRAPRRRSERDEAALWRDTFETHSYSADEAQRIIAATWGHLPLRDTFTVSLIGAEPGEAGMYRLAEPAAFDFRDVPEGTYRIETEPRAAFEVAAGGSQYHSFNGSLDGVRAHDTMRVTINTAGERSMTITRTA